MSLLPEARGTRSQTLVSSPLSAFVCAVWWEGGCLLSRRDGAWPKATRDSREWQTECGAQARGDWFIGLLRLEKG